MSEKYVYLFGGGTADGRAEMKNLLGGKGANLAEMASLGIPVPAGFTITTEMCTVYYKMNRNYPAELKQQVQDGVEHIEKVMGKKFNDPKDPLDRRCPLSATAAVIYIRHFTTRRAAD